MKIINVMTDRIYIKYKDISNISTNEHIKCLDKIGSSYSSVSGYVEGITELISNGVKEKVISILNDFKDDYKEIPFSNKELTDNKDEALKSLMKYGYNVDFSSVDTLNIDLSNEAFLSVFNDEVEDLLKFLDEFCELFDIKQVNFIYKNKASVAKLVSYIGSYLNFKLSKKVVSNKNCLIININKFYEIYYILMRNKCLTETFININVKNKNIYNVKLKIGSNLNEVLRILNIEINNKIIVNENKLYEINDLNYLISSDVTEVYVK